MRVVGLGAAADRGLEVPQQAAVHVEVLEGPGVLGAHQGRNLARLDAEVCGRLQLDVSEGQVAEGFARGILGIHHVGVRHPQRFQRIGAGLQVELEDPVGLLDLHLGVGEIAVPVFVRRRDSVGLAIHQARELTADVHLAERPRVEAGWLGVVGKAGGHRRRRQRIGVGSRAQRERRPRSAQCQFQMLHKSIPCFSRSGLVRRAGPASEALHSFWSRPEWINAPNASGPCLPTPAPPLCGAPKPCSKTVQNV